MWNRNVAPFRKIVAHGLFRIFKLKMWTVRILEMNMWTVRFFKMEMWSVRVFCNTEMLHEERGQKMRRGVGE